MKIVKPLRLSVLNRPFRWQGKNYLGVSVLALTDMGENPQLRPEMELWQLAASELQTSGGVVDMAIPKVRAEFLATGYAYTHHQQEKSACIARIDVDTLSKSLAVSGDRYWAGSKITPAKPFSEMRLDWSRAWGGAGCADNPHGLGAALETLDGRQVRRLPNIESLHGRLVSPQQKPEPAGFGALDIQWPRRFRRMGKKYDAIWLQTDFPGFARDIDWKVFNAASPDQWWPDRDALPPGARWRVWNMHPQKPLQEGTLPPWQARCFINRQRADETLFEEIALRATTVWFFPHLEQMLLIWQGHIRINEDDAADVQQLIPALEIAGAPRTVGHYREVLARRMDKEKGALYAFREKDLLPEALIGPWIDSEVAEQTSPQQENMHNRAVLLREQHRARLEQAGEDIDDLLPLSAAPEIPRLEDLPDFIDKMEQQAQEMQARAEERQQQMAEKYPSPQDDENAPRGPDSMYRMQEMLAGNASGLSDKKREQMRESLHQMYMAAVGHQPPAVRLKGDLATILRQRAERTLAQGGDFSGMDLTGVDFSGMDLRGACFRRALLECADLSRCRLDGADFREAMLARTELAQTSLRECDFSGASLALARAEGCDFTGARLEETQVQNALFEACLFDGAVMKGLLLREVSLIRCRFHKASLDGCIFMDLTLPEPDFRGARLHKSSFIQSRLEGAIFSGATLEVCSLIQTAADGARFDGAIWIASAAAAGSSLNGADFSHATLQQSNLRSAPLQAAQFTLAKIDNSDLSEADCRGACFTRANLVGSAFVRADFRDADFSDANLMGALLQKCRLGGARFPGANLFRADLSQSFTSKTTSLEGAWTKRTKTLPRRDGEII